MVITDGRKRIIAALEVDYQFADYEIEMTPEDALHFVEVAPLAGAPSTSDLAHMIEQINSIVPAIDFGPSNLSTGKPSHRYRVGRERGRRILTLMVFQMFFQRGYDITGLLEDVRFLCKQAGGKMTLAAGDNDFFASFRWAETEAL